MPKTALIPSQEPVDEKKLAQQITDQYVLATNGLVENIALGALIEKVQKIVSTCGHDRPAGGGRDTKGEGLKVGWRRTPQPSSAQPHIEP